MKRKGSNYLDFFKDVRADQSLEDLEDGWLIDFRIIETPSPLYHTIAGTQIPSLANGNRWLYWVPKKGHFTGLLCLDPIGKPLWFYSDVIMDTEVGDDGFPNTQDAYLDITGALQFLDGEGWQLTNTEIIDHEDLEAAVEIALVTDKEAKRITALAEEALILIRERNFQPLEVILKYVGLI